MSVVVGVHRLAPPLLPLSLPTTPHASLSFSSLSIAANLNRNRFVVHRLVISFSQSASRKPDDDAGAADPSVDLGETTLDKNSTSMICLLKRLKRYGISGILSYVLINAVYYAAAYLLVWLYLSKPRGKLGYLAELKGFVKFMAMVYAGSQFTKLVGIVGAVGLAPVVDRGLSWFNKFGSHGKAFATMVGICLAVAVMRFLLGAGPWWHGTIAAF